MRDFIEHEIICAVRELLTGRVNEILSNWQLVVPLFEFSQYKGKSSVVPVITLSSCERTEKERIIQIDAYSLSITITLQENSESELYCFAYTAAVCKAVGENPTLGGIIERVQVTGKKYTPPKVANTGQDWQVVISLRLTVEGNTYNG
jgi:hypothetical protein